MPLAPTAGQFVRARSRLWVVESITEGAADEEPLVELACLDDDAAGTRATVLWNSEVDASIVDARFGRDVARRGFDAPERFAAYLHAQRWACVTATDPTLFQSPYRAGIRLFTYQLEPLRKALRLPRVNLFIADDVGLGKTIEAGLIVRELLIRQRVRRVVIAAPPSVVQQWHDELRDRFGITSVIFDRAFVQARRRERGYGVNPWESHNFFVVSHALIRDETYLGPLRRALEKDPVGSMLIFDEAHNAAPATDSKWALDSKITGALRELAERFEHRLFLSATPHNGHENSFTALLEILDPQRFTRGVGLDKPREQLEPVMVRRLKSDLREEIDGLPLRKVEQITLGGLPVDAPELRLSRLLARYRELREKRLEGESKSVQAAAGLLDVSLQKRLLSSIEAFAMTLDVHKKTLAKAAGKASKQVRSTQLSLLIESPGSDDDYADVPEEQVSREEHAQVEAATLLSAETSADEQTVLDEMTEIAEQHRRRPDPRVNAIIDWIRTHMCPELPAPGVRPPKPAPWLHRVHGREHAARLLIFTEYTDTKRYLEEQLGAAIAHTERAKDRIASFHGGIGDKRREALKKAFNAEPQKHPLRILIATDAAREGINLQNHCADLFHFDLPWNPSRLEQRNGRIDRTLQRERVVTCRYFVLPQRAEDRVLEVMAKKVDRIQRQLGSLGKIVEDGVVRLLSKGVPLARAMELAERIESLPEERRSEIEEAQTQRKDLKSQLAVLRDLLEKARAHMELDPQQLIQALSVSLEILGAERLKPLDPARDTLADEEPVPAGAYAFPRLDALAAADPGWAELLDALRVPKRAEDDESLQAWRRNAPLRPVVFEATNSLDEHVVHLHLEHRIVQRLLGRFRAQGFVHHDLARATVVVTKKRSKPLVVLVGRVGLYGDGASRLHEQLVVSAAEWRDPEIDRGKLRPMSIEDTESVLADLEIALAGAIPASEAARRHALSTVDRDLESLTPKLEERAARERIDAERALGKRATEESKAIAKVLTEQGKRLRKKLDGVQQELPFTEADRKFHAAARAFWEKRATQIEPEIVAETTRIERTYAVRSIRPETIGLVYLWPETG